MKSKFTTDQIIQIVLNITGLEFDAVFGNNRKHELVLARQLMHYFAKKYATEKSIEKIGQKIGNKDHATVLHSVKVINNYLETNDTEVKWYCNKIEFLLSKTKDIPVNYYVQKLKNRMKAAAKENKELMLMIDALFSIYSEYPVDKEKLKKYIKIAS